MDSPTSHPALAIFLFTVTLNWKYKWHLQKKWQIWGHSHLPDLAEFSVSYQILSADDPPIEIEIATRTHLGKYLSQNNEQGPACSMHRVLGIYHSDRIFYLHQRRYNKDPTTKLGTLTTYTRCLAQLRLPSVLFLTFMVKLIFMTAQTNVHSSYSSVTLLRN